MDNDTRLINEAYDKPDERPPGNDPVSQIVDMLTQGFSYLTKEEKLAGINMCRQLLDKLQEEVNKQP